MHINYTPKYNHDNAQWDYTTTVKFIYLPCSTAQVSQHSTAQPNLSFWKSEKFHFISLLIYILYTIPFILVMTCLANEAKNSTSMYIRFKPTKSTEYEYEYMKRKKMFNNFTRVSIPNLYNWYGIHVLFLLFLLIFCIFTQKLFSRSQWEVTNIMCICILTFTSLLEFFLTKHEYRVIPRTNSYSHFVNEFKLWVCVVCISVRVHAVMFIRYMYI